MQIVWFKKDLRVADHRPLFMAASRGPVLPLYIAEPDLWAGPDTSARQWAFATECLKELQADLAALGQPLCVMMDDAVSIFRKLHQRRGITGLWSHEETGSGWTYARDTAVAAWAREVGVPWNEVPQFGVIRRLKTRDGWARAWDRSMAKPITSARMALQPLQGEWPAAVPTASALGLAPDPCPLRQPGGRTAALATLHSFLFERGRDYRFQMSSPLTAFDACSRLSPHLTWGSISMREVAQASVARMEALRHSSDADARAWRASLISFMERQHWHCHFIQKLEDEPRLEFENLHRAYDGVRPDIVDPVRLSAWTNGETGFPFLDACMRALNQYGWINFRMRAMLISFASHHLWLPWRETGLHLARKFVDYEAGIDWPQVQMQSGTTGINTIRIYNPVKQGMDQDPYGAFIRAQVPELRAVPDAFIHEPWHWPGAERLRYPKPIVDNAAAAKAAGEILYGLRKVAGHHLESGKIADKHGSRRAGLPMTGSRAKPKTKAQTQTQLKLDL
jgi:deoxyribodipyrimidine photo-lyase